MKYVIAGYGRFGRLALARLKEAFPETQALIIENNRDKLTGEFPSGTTAIESDAVAFLLNSDLPGPDDVIVPMVPFHLAAAYMTARLPNTNETELPNEIAHAVPNPIRINFSNLLASRVGGYPVRDLIKLLGRVTTGRYLVVTSCKCHGVITAIKRN
jgi:hypothetical protein